MPQEASDPSLEQLALAQAERHVAQGEDAVAHRREIVTQLERDGHDASMARELLSAFEETLAMFKADRERLRQDVS